MRRRNEKKSEPNTAYAYLSIDEFSCSVDKLTERIGLQPTNGWQIGDIVPPLPVPRKCSAWQLKSRRPTSQEVEHHVVDVLDQIRGREAVFQEIAKDLSIRMQCVGYYTEYNPGFQLKPEILKRLGDLGVTLDLDAYYLFEDEKETENNPQ